MHRTSVYGTANHRFARIAVAAVICAAASLADGQVYKCTDDAGRTTYADAACARGKKPVRLSIDAGGGAAGPVVCAQMLDEMRRLAKAAEQDAKRGRGAGQQRARRRQALAGQYERRCAGIRRSDPTR